MLSLLLLLSFQAPQSGSLTLQDALGRALRSRPRGGAASAGVARALAEHRLAGQPQNPVAAYTHTGDTPHSQATLDQPLDWLVTRGAARSATAAGIRRSRVDSVLIMAELARDARIAFFSVLAAERSLALITAQAGAADSLAAMAEARFRAGDISRLELDRTRQDAMLARLITSAAIEARQLARTDLRRAIAWPTGDSLPPLAGSLDAGLDRAPTESGGVGELPGVTAAAADSAIAAMLVQVEQVRRIPVPTLQGGAQWGFRDNPGVATVVLGVAIPLPLWQRQGANVAVARARAELAAAQAGEARLVAARDLESATDRLRQSALRAQVARDSLLPAAVSLRTRSGAAYQAGETGVLPVLEAFRAERDIVAMTIRELFGFQSAHADYLVLLGRIE
jgi:cobalt-zinc-cadmium efflux system outer membrane protein